MTDSRLGDALNRGRSIARQHVDPRSDARFLRDAYRATLGRDADADGVRFYLAQLRGGEPREAVLRKLAQSDEAVARVLGARAGKNFSTAFNLDYPVDPVPRWGWGKPVHPEMLAILELGRDRYREWVDVIASNTEHLAAIDVKPPSSLKLEPAWVNGWIPALDAAALYATIAKLKPRRYLEVGSGNSTLFARRAIRDNGLQTEIVSIDPRPRADIDSIADVCVRAPLEEAGPSLFAELDSNDILFFDGSHRSLTNSDVTVMFTEILPRLRSGVFVQIHDVWLPDDYPEDQANRIYSEQYLLMTMLLAGGGGYEVTFPSRFVARDPELSAPLQPLWNRLAAPGLETAGCSFWMRRQPAN